MQTRRSFDHASVPVTTTAAALSSAAHSNPPRNGVAVKAHAGNAGTVYVGNANTVTANTVAATDGYPLAAGEEITIPIDNAAGIFVIASANTQYVSWIGI